MARRPSTVAISSGVGIPITNKRGHPRTASDSQQTGLSNVPLDDQQIQVLLERYRLLSAKVERCVQELIERVHTYNSTLKFDLLAPPSQLSSYVPSDSKELYFDFYTVWKNPGRFKIERDQSSICCTIKSLDPSPKWSRAEQDRLLLSTIDKRKKIRYFNGRGMRDLFFEILYKIAPDLIRLDFVEHLIYFDLIVPSSAEKYTCHITLFPCFHLFNQSEVFLPFGTLRWYPRSLLCSTDPFALLSLRYPPQIMSIRRYMSLTDSLDETSKLTRHDQRAYARARAIIHEMLSTYTLEHVDSLEQLRNQFENDQIPTRMLFFLPHKSDRNCNVFPAGQHLLDDPRAKKFIIEVLRTNKIVIAETPGLTDDDAVKL